MQKSKTANYIIIAIIFLYTFLSVKYMYSNFSTYLYIINPIFWLSLCGILFFGIQSFYSKKLQSEAMQYTFIAILYYICTYIVTGIIIEFGKSPYNNSILGITNNLWLYGTVIVAREIIRFKIIRNSFDKDKKKTGILLVICFSIFEILTSVVNIKNVSEVPGYWAKTTATQIVPIIVKNILYTYMAASVGYLPAILYELATNMFFWVSPILPEVPWLISATINVIVPTVLLIYITYLKNKKEVLTKEKRIIFINPKGMALLTSVAIVIVWFTSGVFPIKPIAIATPSMTPNINVGDTVIILKTKPSEIELNDIIEYKFDKKSIVHRVVEKNIEKNVLTFITKGDNNNENDPEPVQEESVMGKVIFRIPFIGYPAVLISNIKISF